MPKITFKQSQVVTEWTGDHESILEAGESEGIILPFGCRFGNCTACQQPLLAGSIEYPRGRNGQPDAGNILLCCSVPTSDVEIDA